MELGWHLGDHPFFKFIYHYGNIPALLISLAAIVVTVLSFRRSNYLKYRKIGLFLVLAMIIGPGLLVNTILKDNWGRPRPRNVDEFGGKYRFEEVLTMDLESDGKSFPCGHATMGFYFFTLWFLLRRSRHRLALLFLITGIVYGSFIGLVRMAQGGHFASDVLWAGGIVYLASFLLFRGLKLNHNLFYYNQSSLEYKPKRSRLQFLFWIIGLLIVLALLVATPYDRKQNLAIDLDQAQELEILLDRGDAFIQADSLNYVSMLSSGFAFPGSRIKLVKKSDSVRGATVVKHDKQGLFSELVVHTHVSMAAARPLSLSIRLLQGDLNADLRGFSNIERINLFVGEGKASITLPDDFSKKLYIEGEANLIKSTHILTDDPKEASVCIYSTSAKVVVD